MGSDTRKGKGNHIAGETPGLSDTTILLHLSKDRSRAYGVSIPRDAMVERPTCMKKDGSGTVAGGLTQFNAAYEVGGPACTIKTVESITKVFIDHFVVVDFNGFKQMVDALGGVKVCVPTRSTTRSATSTWRRGTYNVTGDQALDYVRVRHGISANGDIGRMKRQQTFIAAMINKAVSAGTLANPVKLVRFLDAATKSLTTDPGFAHLKALALARLVAEEHRAGQDHLRHRAVRGVSAGPEPAPAQPRRRRAVAADPQGRGARAEVHRRGGQGLRQHPGHQVQPAVEGPRHRCRRRHLEAEEQRHDLHRRAQPDRRRERPLRY